MTTTKLILREMTEGDWDEVAQIYKQGIDSENATFQQTIPSWDEWTAGHIKTCRIVAVLGNEIAAWAALTPVSGRCVYAGVAEVSVYVSNKHTGQKIGSQLLAKLITESEKQGIWTLQAGIFPENIPSLKIHENAGFRKVGYREKIGKMAGTWRDVVLVERRSKLIGLD